MSDEGTPSSSAEQYLAMEIMALHQRMTVFVREALPDRGDAELKSIVDNLVALGLDQEPARTRFNTLLDQAAHVRSILSEREWGED